MTILDDVLGKGRKISEFIFLATIPPKTNIFPQFCSSLLISQIKSYNGLLLIRGYIKKVTYFLFDTFKILRLELVLGHHFLDFRESKKLSEIKLPLRMVLKK